MLTFLMTTGRTPPLIGHCPPPDRILTPYWSGTLLTNDQAAMGTNRFLIAALRPTEEFCQTLQWNTKQFVLIISIEDVAD